MTPAQVCRSGVSVWLSKENARAHLAPVGRGVPAGSKRMKERADAATTGENKKAREMGAKTRHRLETRAKTAEQVEGQTR
jgi:hypothetical protein